MKPFYNQEYEELYSPPLRAERRYKRFLVQLSIFGIFFLSGFMFLIYNYHLLMILVLFALCVASMLHLRFLPWLGADLNTLLTVFASMRYGLAAGLFIGTASIVGIILFGDADNNIIFDFFGSSAVALFASFFPLAMYLNVVLICAIIYVIIALLFHYLMGTWDFLNVTWTITNFVWILFVVLKLIPLLSRLSFFVV
jgi:hypothetical protein